MDNENNINNEQLDEIESLTVPSTPPVPGQSQRRSKWPALFEECREQPGVWRRTVEHFRPKTAAQVASDIRNSWRRDPKKMRLRGLQKGERWEASWGPAADATDPEQCFIWLRYVSGGIASDGVPSDSDHCPRDEIAW